MYPMGQLLVIPKSPLKHNCDPHFPSAYGLAEVHKAMQGNLVAHRFLTCPIRAAADMKDPHDIAHPWLPSGEK